MKDIKVYGLGNAIVDLQLAVGDDVLNNLGLKKGSMELVTLEQQKGLMAAVTSEAKKSSGGSMANTIMTLAQLGDKTAYSFAVGNDADGKFYATELAELGVLADVHIRDGSATGTSVVMITPDAERTMSTHLGASFSFGPKDVSEEIIKRSEWLFIEGYLLSSPPSSEAALLAVELAKKHGTKVAFTCSDVFIINCFRDAAETVVKSSSLVFANLVEAGALVGAKTNETNEDLFGRFVEYANEDCVMTMSAKGAMINQSGRWTTVPGETVKAIDETGAGDVFAGGFLHGVLNNMSAEESGRLACKLAGKVVSKLGARLTTDLIRETL